MSSPRTAWSLVQGVHVGAEASSDFARREKETPLSHQPLGRHTSKRCNADNLPSWWVACIGLHCACDGEPWALANSLVSNDQSLADGVMCALTGFPRAALGLPLQFRARDVFIALRREASEKRCARSSP
ncbi:hypothetical protein HBI82_075970 [Parastagonospora nodorum]|nr:hypothetical protein HBH75_004480 [Parastagonospora nodorum]KAH5484828.1 hypothetical protein HBI31_164660 [Parastagonospora nodorum]KAH5637464.1 hypothetical protein HBI51_159290 [Parastagonospora nodorum]KAH6022891.1 hypothetical protein HBI82_075970 [Parastagonospora nodorum]KAH6163756.1 hypothetical protein HBI63_039480 [Parastagonospora nodorum]